MAYFTEYEHFLTILCFLNSTKTSLALTTSCDRRCITYKTVPAALREGKIFDNFTITGMGTAQHYEQANKGGKVKQANKITASANKNISADRDAIKIRSN